MSQVIFEVQEAPEGGDTDRAIGYSIFTEAETIEELQEMARDAIRTHFDDNSGRQFAIRLRNTYLLFCFSTETRSS